MTSGLFKRLHILLVEDNEGDAVLVEIALREVNAVSELSVVTDGVKAMKYLRNQPPYEETQLPDLVMLDLNLPKKSGREVLGEIKSDPELKAIPVVVFTSSSSDEDIFRSYQAGANCYVTKPIDFHDFREVVKAIVNFWSTVITLPPGVGGQ